MRRRAFLAAAGAAAMNGPTTLRAQPVANKGRIAAALREQVWPLFASRGIKPVIYARFPLTDAAGAHRLMESDAHIGKIVLLT